MFEDSINGMGRISIRALNGPEKTMLPYQLPIGDYASIKMPDSQIGLVPLEWPKVRTSTDALLPPDIFQKHVEKGDRIPAAWMDETLEHAFRSFRLLLLCLCLAVLCHLLLITNLSPAG